ncbi:MAG: PrsW family intramembrane metalloprotease [Anaerolineales bacterium]|nr:PrsW family intramembrane metalloprotease [Anaerolineales bacterium]
MPALELTIALLVAALIPLAALWFIYKRDLYATGSIDSIIASFLGGAGAFVLAYLLHTWLLQQGIAFSILSRNIAPFSEEILKALVLAWLVRRRNFTYFVDGAIYGFAAGIGFAIMENFNYVFGQESSALTVAIGRTLSSNLVHATTSALVGITLGLGRFQRGLWRRWLYLLGGLLVAVAVHSGYNHMLFDLHAAPMLVFLYAVLAGLGGSGAIVGIIRVGLAEERCWIQETLGEADRVTRNEARAVHQLAEIGVILAPLAQRFGKEEATLIGECLVMQARLGILRKTLEKLPEEWMRQETQANIDQLQKEMDALRRRVGTFAMLYLRNIFPDTNRSVWSRLEQITESAGSSAGLRMIDILDEPDALRRAIMKLLLRKKGRATLAELEEGLQNLASQALDDQQGIAQALAGLVNAGRLTRLACQPETYQINLRFREGARLPNDIWSSLEILSLGQVDGRIDRENRESLWGSLKAQLEEQVAAQSSSPAGGLWSSLADKISED